MCQFLHSSSSSCPFSVRSSAISVPCRLISSQQRFNHGEAKPVQIMEPSYHDELRLLPLHLGLLLERPQFLLNPLESSWLDDELLLLEPLFLATPRCSSCVLSRLSACLFGCLFFFFCCRIHLFLSSSCFSSSASSLAPTPNLGRSRSTPVSPFLAVTVLMRALHCSVQS